MAESGWDNWGGRGARGGGHFSESICFSCPFRFGMQHRISNLQWRPPTSRLNEGEEEKERGEGGWILIYNGKSGLLPSPFEGAFWGRGQLLWGGWDLPLFTHKKRYSERMGREAAEGDLARVLSVAWKTILWALFTLYNLFFFTSILLLPLYPSTTFNVQHIDHTEDRTAVSTILHFAFLGWLSVA